MAAQPGMPEIFPVEKNLPTTFTLDNKYWQILDDKNDNYSIQQFSDSTLRMAFRSPSASKIGIDYSINTYWIRYILKNTSNEDVTICLFNNNLADQSDFYIVRSGTKTDHLITGTLYPLAKRDGLKKPNYIPVLLTPGEQLAIFNKIRNSFYYNKPRYLSVQLGSYEKVLQQYFLNEEENYTSEILNHIFNGIYLFGIFVYFFFFIVSREKVYLFYSLFLGYLFYLFDPLGYVIFPGHPSVYLYIGALISPAGVVLYIQFLRDFLKISIHTPKWDKYLNVMCILLVCSSLASFYIEPYLQGNLNSLSVYISRFMFLSCLASMLISFLIYIKRGTSSISILLISGSPVIIYETFIRGLMDIYSILNDKFDILVPRYLQWFEARDGVINNSLMAWLAIVFSWGLFQRFLDLQKRNAHQELEKVRLQKEQEVTKNKFIEQQKIELATTVAERTSELQRSFENLKATQTQLIQSEKMASLGELTAGIAHEIQNPLNFVNNFSEVNKDLLGDMQLEIEQGNIPEIREISKDLLQNMEKISHHGKRAESIVKAMLQHSMTSNGQKESTDINALADEYYKLANQVIRTKEKDFFAQLETHFDKSLENINVVRQEIGRVLLNLYNNAFYTVAEKNIKMGNGYIPSVSISTKNLGDHIELRVRDNGMGIPDKLKEKIFQPFFTTKPTGQGTGLGLSLSYDIVKAHQGSLQVDSREGEYTEFLLLLPA